MFGDARSGVWKHALSGLYAAQDRGGAPTVAPPVETNPVFERVALAAAVGLETHPDVLRVQVSIDGTEQQPQAQIDCMLTPSGDLARMAELIDSCLLEQMELLLGREFTAVDVRIQHSTRQHTA